MRSAPGMPAGSNAVAIRLDNTDFLRITRDLRRVHSHIAALAYPVLERTAEKDDRDSQPSDMAATEAGHTVAPGDRI